VADDDRPVRGPREAAPSAPASPPRLERRRIELPLRHAWTIARGTSASKANVLVRVRRSGLSGLGEAAPNARYQEDWLTVMAALEQVEPLLEDDLSRWTETLDRVEAALPRDHAARAAIDIALHDLAAQGQGVPLWRLLGADPAAMPPTSFSIGLDTIPVMQQKVREAAPFPILKVKLGGADDRAVIEGIRAVTDKPLSVDANEGWKEPGEAIEMIGWLAGMGVVLVEQPLPAADLDGARRVRAGARLPIFADEAVVETADVGRVREAYDGINIKLQKSGGLRPARRLLDAARAAGMKVMIGCMIETSIGITAAAHLAPLADHADLDGNLLLAADPFRGAVVRDGRLVLPEGPGLGVVGDW
jgi:L-alanine-DL-glutamate epimerase-like enolase superfamily enzyme